MVTAWQILLPVLLITSMSLIIPLAIVLGHRHPTGALLLSGGGLARRVQCTLARL
jgi:hypothetical protein